MAGIEDPIRLDTAFGLLAGGDPPCATCPHDDEPLVMTMEFAGAEFICMVCRRLFGFLAPTPKPNTPELQARHDQLRAQYLAEREARRLASNERTGDG